MLVLVLVNVTVPENVGIFIPGTFTFTFTSTFTWGFALLPCPVLTYVYSSSHMGGAGGNPHVDNSHPPFLYPPMPLGGRPPWEFLVQARSEFV